MKLSVIIPAHNEEKRLPDTLRAVLRQDHPDFEVIVIDNASTDRTADVARGFNVIVIHEGNKGTLWACEAGRKAASGEVIVRTDADCLPEPDWLSRGAKHLNDPRVVGATGPYDYHDANPSFRSLSLFTQRYIYRHINIIFQKARIGSMLIEGNSFMRAQTLEDIGGFDTRFVFYGDGTDTAKRMSRFGHIVFDTGLTMKTSARRFKSQGFLTVTAKYLYHFFKTSFTKVRPPSKNQSQT